MKKTKRQDSMISKALKKYEFSNTGTGIYFQLRLASMAITPTKDVMFLDDDSALYELHRAFECLKEINEILKEQPRG